MTVKELIAALSKINPDLPVRAYEWDLGDYDDIVEVNVSSLKELEQYARLETAYEKDQV